MNFIITILLILAVIMVFNFIIFFHELGHFLAAKWRGVTVDRFQIWFGKPIWKKTIGGVQYGLGTIPLGGFVSLPEMAPMEAIEGKKLDSGQSLKKISPLDKIIVAFAGPLFSFLLAFLFAIVVWKVGKIEYPNTSTVIGYVMPDSPAEKAGLQAGDKILEIQGKKPVSFDGKYDAVTTMIALSEGEEIDFKIEREGSTEPIIITSEYEIPETPWFQRSAMRRIGIAGKQKVFIGNIMKYSPASKADIKTGDEIIRVNGKPVTSFGTIIEATKDAEKPVAYTLKRGEQILDVTIQPEYPDIIENREKKKMIGVGFQADPANELTLAHPSPWTQIKESSQIMFKSIAAVVNTATSVGVDQFSSPLGIGKSMFQMLAIEGGWKMLLWFLVILNVNLAIFNLMPFPVLDGGHIVFAIAEWITGKQIKMKVINFIQTYCVLCIFALFLFILVKDIGDFFTPKERVEFLPDSQ